MSCFKIRTTWISVPFRRYFPHVYKYQFPILSYTVSHLNALSSEDMAVASSVNKQTQVHTVLVMNLTGRSPSTNDVSKTRMEYSKKRRHDPKWNIYGKEENLHNILGIQYYWQIYNCFGCPCCKEIYKMSNQRSFVLLRLVYFRVSWCVCLFVCVCACARARVCIHVCVSWKEIGMPNDSLFFFSSTSFSLMLPWFDSEGGPKGQLLGQTGGFSACTRVSSHTKITETPRCIKKREGELLWLAV